MKQGRLILINVLIIVAILIIGGVVWYSWSQNYNYVSTQDASINAPSVTVVALQSGTISGIDVTTGQRVTKGQVIAQESVATTSASSAKSGKTAGASSELINIAAPVTGRIATITTGAGQTVAAGSPILTEVQLTHVTVVANIPETEIRRVSAGQSATIYVDAHPGVAFTGTVEAIQPATQSFFSLIPTTATSGTYIKVEQRIPVTLSIDNAGYALLPGESCTVRITVH